MRHGGCSPYPWKSLNLATSVGDSKENVLENRRRIFNSLDLSPNAVFDVWQIHSSDVIIPTKKRAIGEPHQKADAIVTNKSEFSLLMLFADCVPILFFDPKNSVIGIAHAGWKGTISKIVLNVVNQMKLHFNSKIADIYSIIGPCISAEKYQIDEDVSDLIGKAFKNGPEVIRKQNNKIFLDLGFANRILLKSAGIRKIEDIQICTASNKEDWFSHRQEKGKTGRFGAVISLSD